jgi:hypothetical protein
MAGFRTVYYAEEFRVLRQERITVRAGTFNTFVVQWREYARNVNYDAPRTWWIAPDLGYSVKSTFTQAVGLPQKGAEWEAVRVAAPNMASDVR